MENRLYILNTDVFSDRVIFDRSYLKMSADRKKKIDAFRFGKDKRLSLGAGVLLRELVTSGYDEDDVMGYSENGKPFVKEPGGVFFNLSHAGKYAVCAVSDRPVGVDIETVQLFDDALVRHVFNDGEAEYICSSSSDINCGFTGLWTIKESLMKYFGIGMLLDPKDINVDLSLPISASADGYSCSGLHFTQFGTDTYSITVCSEYENFSDSVSEFRIK